jgi:hypothetical protein
VSEHTPEPWTLHKHDHARGEVWLSINRGAIDVTHNVEDGQICAQKYSVLAPKERQANAYRIVACVNACAGMEDPAATIKELRAFAGSILREKKPEPNGHTSHALLIAELQRTREALRKTTDALEAYVTHAPVSNATWDVAKIESRSIIAEARELL